MRIRRKLVVKGLVQGVSFRKHTRMVAGDLGVNGWVRNVSNGTVEACIEGEKQAVEALVAWCALGPKRSHVEEVLIRKSRYRGRFTEFNIREDRLVA